MYRVGGMETIHEIHVSGLFGASVELKKSILGGDELGRALKAKLRDLIFNWIHYWFLSKGVRDDNTDLRKPFLRN